MMTTMMDMAKSPEQVKEEAKPYDERPIEVQKYPYGLCICLDNDMMQKLGLDGDCEAGDGIQFMAMAKVTSVSSRELADGSTDKRIELQITHMGLGPDHAEEYTS